MTLRYFKYIYIFCFFLAKCFMVNATERVTFSKNILGMACDV